MEARKREKSSSRHRSSPAPGMGSRPGQVNLPLQPMHKRNRESPAPNTASTSASNRRSGTIRSGRSDHGNSRPCQEHSFLTDVAEVRQMEHGLLGLLEDFHSGKLQAFSQDGTFEKMDQVREQQERLARLHFELDNQQEIQGFESAESRVAANKNMSRLMDNLSGSRYSQLCYKSSAVLYISQNLQKDQPTAKPPS